MGWRGRMWEAGLSEVAELRGGGVRGKEGYAGPAAESEHGLDLGDPLGVRGVASEGVEAKPAAIEGAMERVPAEETRAEASALLAAVARDHHVGEELEGGHRARVVLRGGAYEWGGEEEDCDVEGGEGLRHGGPLAEPRSGTARGDEGCCGGYGEGVGAPGGA